MTQIKSIKQLKKVCAAEKGADFFILLNYNLRSSKCISWFEDTKTFFILNEIDGSEQELSEEQLMDKEYTNIGEAIKKGAFYKY